MTKIWTYIQASLDNFSPGASAKKLTALVFTLLSIWLHFKFATGNNALEFLITDVSTLTALLGVSTIQTMRAKNSPKNEPETPQ